MPKQYFCDCEKHCKGHLKEVSCSTFQRHTSFRIPLTSYGPLLNPDISFVSRQPASGPHWTHMRNAGLVTQRSTTPVWLLLCRTICLYWLRILQTRIQNVNEDRNSEGPTNLNELGLDPFYNHNREPEASGNMIPPTEVCISVPLGLSMSNLDALIPRIMSKTGL